MQKGRKGVRERKKFQIFQIFRPSLGKNSANKGKKKEVEGKFSPPYRQETPRAPCRARLRARCKKSGICVYTCQSARCKSHHVPRGAKVSVCGDGHGVPQWAKRGKSLIVCRKVEESRQMREGRESPTDAERPPTAEPRMGGNEPHARV